MIACRVCGKQALLESAALCFAHRTFESEKQPPKIPADIEDAVNELLDDEGRNGACVMLMAIEAISSGISKAEASSMYDLPVNTLLLKWRKYSISRDANCVLHKGLCDKCKRH